MDAVGPEVLAVPVSFHKAKWAITIAASLGWFFDAYVITIYALTIPDIALAFHVPTTILSGVVGSTFLVGYAIGTIGFGYFGDRFGRKTILGISIVGYGITTALTGLVGGLASLGILRFLTGVAGGGELTIGAPYVSEVWERDRRSSGIGIMYSFYPMGFVFAVIVYMLVSPIWGWRAVYAISLLPAIVVLLFRVHLEESPRFTALVTTIEKGHRRINVLQAFANPVFRFRVLTGFLIFSSLTYGYYAMVFYIPAFVVHTYGLTPGHAAAVTAILQVAGIAGGLSGGFAGDTIGRRVPAMIAGFLTIATILVWWGGSWSLPVFCVLVGVGGYLVAFEWALGIVYVNELFPTEVRAGGFGTSAGMARIVAISAPIVTQVLASTIGVAHAIEISSVVWFALICGYFISHETHGTELADRLDDLSHRA